MIKTYAKKTCVLAVSAAIALGALGVINTPAENVVQASETTPVSEAVLTVPSSFGDCGFAEVLEQAGDVTKITQSEIDNVDLWGYTNLGIAKVDNHLNVRKEPNTSGKLVGKMSNNAACEILRITPDGEWAQIKSGEVEGYVNLEYLLMGVDAFKQAKSIVAPKAVSDTDGLNVREFPNTDSEIITKVAKGEELEVSKVLDDGWVEVYLDDELVYVSADYVKIDETLGTAITMTELLYGEGVSDVRVDLCQYAKQFIGNPYVWGGTSLTNGADCSGFVLSVFKKYGVTLPHYSVSQATYGTKVSMDEIKAGDLVFYGKGNTINHVAIYIGNGQVVHASNKREGIKISNVYYRTPMTARSILID
ncbi:MAG: C40 family peptidase [Lachnospiraceae bacterium]|nr:C40 family peptidase [Lachnospiraceae bacterium]